MQDERQNSDAEGGVGAGLATVGVAVFAMACCGLVPLLAALASGVAAGALLGAGATLLGLLALVATIIFVVRARRRRACAAPASAALEVDGERPTRAGDELGAPASVDGEHPSRVRHGLGAARPMRRGAPR